MTPPIATLVDLVRMRGTDARADEIAITFLQHGQPAQCLTGAALWSEARRVAGALCARGLQPGARVLVMATTQRDFVLAFFGAVTADLVPVPVFPPLFASRLDEFLTRFSSIAKSADADALLVSRELVEPATSLAGAMHAGAARELQVLGPDAWNDVSATLHDERPRRTTDDLAFLQYTSGSTGSPRGVALRHRQVLANVRAIGQATSFDAHDVGISWLPLYHDMGLIGGLFSTLNHGAHLVAMSPLDFARRPVTWLHALTEYRGTMSPAPNFAFRRCLQLADADLEGLDLSSWRLAFNGAEPVDARTLRAFAERFAAVGFSARALYPVYGLAEHTLAVTFPRPGEEIVVESVDRDALTARGHAGPATSNHDSPLTFVGVGRALPGVQLRIVDGTRACARREVGEVHVRSASVMEGYFGDDDATREVLDADGWLRTGDLGYLNDDDVLFITGRSKDLIIRAGRNHHPQDLESATHDVEHVRAGRVVAVSVRVDGADAEAAIVAAATTENDERVVMLVEVTTDDASVWDDVARRIAEACARRVGFRPDHVVLLARNELPVTSSGKLQRKAGGAAWRAGSLVDLRMRG